MSDRINSIYFNIRIIDARLIFRSITIVIFYSSLVMWLMSSLSRFFTIRLFGESHDHLLELILRKILASSRWNWVERAYINWSTRRLFGSQMTLLLDSSTLLLEDVRDSIFCTFRLSHSRWSSNAVLLIISVVLYTFCFVYIAIGNINK